MRFSINRTISKKIIIALGAGILASGTAFGQVVAPTPLEQPQPESPTNRAGMPIEGWAIVRFSVLADGTTDNVRVIDNMPASLSAGTVGDAIESWRFAPATSDGVPIAWYNNEGAILFDAPTPPAQQGDGENAPRQPQIARRTPGVANTARLSGQQPRGAGQAPGQPRPAFVAGYREVEDLLAAGELEDALDRSDELVNREANRVSEFSVGLVQNARAHVAAGDLHEAYAAITRVTHPDLPVLDPTELPVALQYRNTIELRLGNMVAALETYRRRQAAGPVPDSDVMASNAETIEERLQSTEVAIGVQGKILDDVWWHELTRRTFAIGDLDGDLRLVIVECDRSAAEFEYSLESEWTLPESWGTCAVMVTGRRDTEFVLYEFQ